MFLGSKKERERELGRVVAEIWEERGSETEVKGEIES